MDRFAKKSLNTGPHSGPYLAVAPGLVVGPICCLQSPGGAGGYFGSIA